MSKILAFVSVAAVLAIVLPAASAEEAQPLSALAKMPVKQITVFKDGHAFLMHQGKMPVTPEGNVVMDYLPSPVLGTFWPFSSDKAVKLTAVTAGQRRVRVESTALDIRSLIEGNVGAEVVITELPTAERQAPLTYPATIVAVPARSGEELEANQPPNAGPRLPEKGNVVLLKTAEGVKAVLIDRIQDVTFKFGHQPKSSNEEFRNLLTLKLDWPAGKPAKDADVGLFYVQRGVRWIPSYKIVIDGKGAAAVKLQATLVNELVDLDDVTANLVIGVPKFAFKDQNDPIGLQQVMAQVSQQMRNDLGNNGQFSNLSNAYMVQTQTAAPAADMGGAGAPGIAQPADLGPEIAGSGRSEDLYVFTVKHVTLKKGQRMVLPVAEFSLPYKDVYTLDVPFVPPAEALGVLNPEQRREIAQMLSEAKVMHKLRLTDKSEFPLTTAPALILRDDQILAQALMTYTPEGGDIDIAITTAVDIRVKKADKETQRTPNAVNWQNQTFGRIDLAGTITLTNFRKEAVDLEVRRHVLGNVLTADHDGKVQMVNVLEDDAAQDTGPGLYGPTWYRPEWWSHFNGIGRITWNFKLEPGKAIDLGYTWNYYWR